VRTIKRGPRNISARDLGERVSHYRLHKFFLLKRPPVGGQSTRGTVRPYHQRREIEHYLLHFPQSESEPQLQDP
jgi:hypothetical protein